jgi:cold shock CspA family protein
MNGRIKSLTRGQGIGYIRDAKGRDVFFHKADVLDNQYNNLDEGVAVRFEVVEDRISGTRAQRVRPDRKAKRRVRRGAAAKAAGA